MASQGAASTSVQSDARANGVDDGVQERSPRRDGRSSRSHRNRRRSVSSSSGSTSSVEGSRRTIKENVTSKSADLAQKEAKGEQIRQQLAKLSATRAGGAYVPPARLRALMAEAAAADQGSIEYQRMSWDALKKSITGLVNKVAAENIKFIVPELFGGANLIRGRGLFCRSIMKAQMQSLAFTPVFASLAAIVNTKLPMVGELLAIRLVSQFRRSFKRNDKAVCSSTAIFIAHLVNQRVLHEIVALEMLVLLLEQPTDDSVEIAVGFMREVGAFLAEEAPKANSSIFDRFRAVLYEGQISKRVQYMIEVLSQVRRDKYKDNVKIPEALDLVEEEDQITHQISLEDDLNVEETLNVFRADPNYEENEEKYRDIKNEILGEGSDSAGGEESGSEEQEESSEEEHDDEKRVVEQEQARVEIQDRTETNLVNLRRTIYLTIMSSAIFEEAVHKLMKLDIPEGKEMELCNMVIECCSQERTFTKFFGLIGERLCKLNKLWSGCFEECFRIYYDSIHRYETNRLRNVARFFGWILAADGISWACFSNVHMTEEDTTSSSRIFIKILFGEMKEHLGLKKLVQRFKEPSMQQYYVNMMPRNDPKATRFSINFFTSIGVPQITDDMREHLKVVREEALAKAQLREEDSSDSDSTLSSSSYYSSSSSYSSSDSEYGRGSRRRSRSISRTPPRRKRSPDRSPSPRQGRRYDDSRSPPVRRRRSYTRSRSYDSRSPSPRRSSRSDSRSPPRRSTYRYDDRQASRSPSRTSREPVRRPMRDAFSPDRHVRSRSRSPLPPPRRRPPSRSPSPAMTRKRSRYEGRASRSPTYTPSPPRRQRQEEKAGSSEHVSRRDRSPTYTPPRRT